MKKKLIKHMRDTMKKYNRTHRDKFVAGFSQGVFDTLMDIDIKFKLGAFFKKDKV